MLVNWSVYPFLHLVCFTSCNLQKQVIIFLLQNNYYCCTFRFFFLWHLIIVTYTKAFSSRTYKVLIYRIIIYVFISYIMAIHLSHIYTTNFGQQSGRIDVILISTTLHIQTAVNAIILGGKKNNSPLSAETRLQFCWYELHPRQKPGVLCQYHMLAWLHRQCS